MILKNVFINCIYVLGGSFVLMVSVVIIQVTIEHIIKVIRRFRQERSLMRIIRLREKEILKCTNADELNELIERIENNNEQM